MVKTRPLLAMALAFALGAPPMFARNSARQQQELEQLARDLNRALGAGKAEVHGGRPSAAAQGSPRVVRGLSAEAVVAEMNRERAAYGLTPLRLNEKLSLAAGDRMQDLFAKHYFEHVSPDGIDPFSWVDKRGYSYTEVGENLAVGYPSANGLVDGWMRSPGHRANILHRSFDEVGIAVAPGSPTRRYTGPTIVALYGTRG